MLEAWEKAEKIGYQYIGEEIREPSNIVEYNINKEITKDASNVINANNDTTTGMATLIYGVNAPKLLEKTSVYRNEVSLQGQSTLTFNNSLDRPDDNSGRIREATIVKDYGNIEFVNKNLVAYDAYGYRSYNYNGVVIPVSGTYELTITYPYIYTGARNSTETRLYKGCGGRDNDVLLASCILTRDGSQSKTETIHCDFVVGDIIYVWNEYISSAVSEHSVTATTTIVITLL